jgi:protein-S-isoprenylcysteine O-methyltransferase Ste14
LSSSTRFALAGSVLSRALLVLLFTFFAWANLSSWLETGEPSGLGLMLLEGWVALMFVIRRPARDVSLSRLAWIAAPIGTFTMLLARPAEGGLPPLLCEIVQLAGVAFAIVSLTALGRSFGLVAANRGVKTRGPYGLVRHPAYAGYLISYVGYVAENPSLRNIGLLLIGTAFQLIRIREEEQLLSRDSAYDTYRRRVRYRLIPLVY